MDAEGRAGRGARGRGESAFRRTEAPPGGACEKNLQPRTEVRSMGIATLRQA
ncbi:Uncharacterized protein DAT39_023566 [Clarias magur]|uniref:Uncharacterized protein n=1 Tax=Clarias magur TaxID=1594786 RepID=A0A8J4T0Z2_CLAMG|nr:Uncharacterized protein DAT39_023566 [Clarias magur]